MNILQKDSHVNYILKTLYLNGINTNAQLYAISEDELKLLNGINAEQIEAIKVLQKIQQENDLFEKCRIELLEPTRMTKFFSDFNLNAKNIIHTKLSELTKKNRITNGRISVFIEFKSECLRLKYNDTLNPTLNQTPEEIIYYLWKSFSEPFKVYLSPEQYAMLKEKFENLVGKIKFRNVHLEKYSQEIISLLDYEYFLHIESSSFLKEILYQVVVKQRKEISLFILKQTLQSLHIFDMKRLNETLQNLLHNGFIVYTPRGIKYKHPTVMRYLKSTLEDFEIIHQRLHGKTLEEIGKGKNLTRERIRQLEKREADNIPFQKLYEYRFVPFYQQYNLSSEEFRQVFHLNEVQYEFLKVFFTKGQLKEKYSKEELLESQTLASKEQEELLKIINKDYILIENHRIKKNKRSIVAYCVKKYAQKTIKVQDFQLFVIDFCKVNMLSKEFDFSSIRALETILSNIDSLLWKYGRQFRYYAIEKSKVISTLNEINFNRYNNQELSAKRILIDYKEELSEIEVFDEYELHNLFKKYKEFLPDNIVLMRMPLLKVGEADREEQLLDFLIEHSPISKDDFAIEYSKKYGILVETIKANYLPLLREYEDGECLNADTPLIPQETLHRLQTILTKDFYLKEDVYDKYKQHYGKEKLPDFIFSQINYRSYSDFILKDKYIRADLYFKETYFNKDSFKISDKRLMYLGSFRKTLNDLREQMEIFEFDKNEFISFKALHQRASIEKTDIINLIKRILNEVGDKYFTVDMIEPIIEDSVLYKLGFDHIFYESILKGIKELRFQYMANKVVFRRTKDKFFIYNFIEEIVSRFKRIDVYELISYLSEIYSILLTKETIIQCTEMTNLYYHPVMEMMFQDIDEFYEMMEEN